MAITYLTTEQHKEVLCGLVKLAHSFRGTRIHEAGEGYTSIMVCLMMHNVTAADSLLRLHDSYGAEWFPATVGFTIVRTMFEADVNMHYISRDPVKMARLYIDWGHVTKKQRMDCCIKLRNSPNESVQAYANMEWEHCWARIEKEVNAEYDKVRGQFQRASDQGKEKLFQNWSGKTLRKMAIEVDHEEAYEHMYGPLSSFTHADVRLADRFHGKSKWSPRAFDGDVGDVFQHAAIFLTCCMELVGGELRLWSKEQVRACWARVAKSNSACS